MNSLAKNSNLHSLFKNINIERSLFWITAALMFAAIIYPASMAIRAAFYENDVFTLIGFQRILELDTIISDISNTLIFSTGSMFGATIIGVSLAWVNARTDVPGVKAIEVFCVIPFFMSAFVGAIAWRLLFVPNAGMISTFLLNHGVPPILLPDIYSLGSMVFIQSVFYSPFMYLYAVASFRQMDPTLEEIARIHGAGNWSTFRKITLSVNGPALLSGMILVFVMSVGTLEVPMALGSAGGNYVLSTRIWALMNNMPQDVTAASALGMIAILIATIGILIQRKLLGNRKFTTVTGKGYKSKRISLGKWKWVVFILAVIYILFAVIMPIITLILVALQKFWTGSFSLQFFTLDNFYTVLFEYDVTARAIKNSMFACSVAATISVGFALILSQVRSRNAEAFMGLLVLLPIVIPGAVFGMMVLFAFVKTPIYNTIFIIIFAYVIAYFYLAYRTIYSVRLSIHPELEQSARIHGASWFQSTRRILMPLLKPGIVSAWLMSFILFIREFSSVMFLYRHGTEVMPVVFFMLMERHSARLAAFMVIQTAILLLIMIIYQRFTSKNSTGAAF
jgi:iron(III) transport system permease protein